MIKEMGIDVPDYNVFIVESSEIIRTQDNESPLPAKIPRSQKMSTDEEDLQNLDNRCCFGTVNMIVSLYEIYNFHSKII